MREDDARRRTPATDQQQQRHQHEVLESVVQDDRVPVPLQVRELDRPAHVRDRPRDLAVDEIGEPAEAHDPRGRDGELVCHGEEVQALPSAEDQRARGAAKQEAVGRHPAQPVEKDVPRVLPVIGPLVEEDLHRSPARKDGKHQQKGQRPRVAPRHAGARPDPVEPGEEA